MTHLELSILLPAFAAGALVLATHVPLGIEVLKRGIIFIDLAIAQVAGLGALAATLYLETHGEHESVIIQLCSLGAALGGAWLLTWTEKHFHEIQEALIGCLFVFSASLALLLLGQNPHGGEHMKDLLAGQILWVSPRQLALTAGLYAALLAAWFLGRARLGRAGFYILFAFAVTASVQMVGVYLVFASLILPAIATRHAPEKRRLWIAYGIGIVGLLLGLLLSSLFDLATGPSVVCGLFAVALIKIVGERRPNSPQGA
ncbi:MAG: metal ABC transporter permease [Alphaproteobacteria bacterium]